MPDLPTAIDFRTPVYTASLFLLMELSPEVVHVRLMLKERLLCTTTFNSQSKLYESTDSSHLQTENLSFRDKSYETDAPHVTSSSRSRLGDSIKPPHPPPTTSPSNRLRTRMLKRFQAPFDFGTPDTSPAASIYGTSTRSTVSTRATTVTTSLASKVEESFRSMILQPGDMPARLPKGSCISPQDIRGLNDLIRQRYALDVEIWGLRGCRPRDRYIVEEKMRKSDVILLRILSTIERWDRPEVWSSVGDYNRFKSIQKRLKMGGGKRKWMDNPPWDDE